ncbi:MAG: carboxypeptidase regulatory-like domain-containing protein [Planctomycetes bacterium]|nr:carboxypeptidase regulatory-like domain-containing protein [Planctomycetota bacterium]MCL4729918.1 carboxypeptidase regulatory-like domain-containing protein [Planctomycetota bacterium]
MRKPILIVALSALLLLGLGAVWLVLAPPAETRKGFGPAGAAARSQFDTRDDLLDRAQRPDGTGGRATTKDSARDDVTGLDRPRGRGPGATAGDEPGPDGVADGATPVNPEEVNAPVPGHLLVRVTDRVDERPLVGASVYFPLRASRLEADGGDVQVGAALAPLRKRANRFGVAIWSAAELEKLRKDQPGDETATSVLVTHIGYADLFEPLAIPDLAKGAEVTLKLFTALRVTGKVREKRGSAVRNIRIDVLQTSRQGDAGAPPNRLSVTSDGLGEFSLKIADAYTYRFEVKTSGYAPYLSREFDFRRDEREVSILLEPARGLAGVVTDSANRPVEGARVHAVNDLESTFTDAQGRFTFDMVRDRIWTNDVVLRFTAKGFAPYQRTVLANDREIKVQLQPEGTLEAVVVTDKGDPVPGALVACTYIEGNARFPFDAQLADAAGLARFEGFGTGRAMLTATFENLASDPVTVDVRPGHTARAKVVVRVAATITGRVTSAGNPIAGVTISLDGKTTTASGADGWYTLAGVTPGDHTVKVTNQFPIADAQLRQLPIFTTDGVSYYYLPPERKLKLKLAASEIVDFECPPFDARVDRKITVKVTTQPLEPVTGVQVTVKPVLGAPPAGVDAPKTLLFAVDLPEGRADIPLSLLNGVSYEMTLVHNRYFTGTLGRDALADVPDGGSVTLTLERAFIIKGYVKDSQGNGMESVGLSKDRNNPWAQDALTDIHGYFEFGQLREGDYLITAFKTGYYQEKREVKVEGRDPDPITLNMVSANEIRIVVTNNGTPQPGARVDIYRNDAEGEDPDDYKRHFDIGTTDANGVKYINFHWIRNYQIVATYGSEIAFANFNNVANVPEREVVIELEPALTLKGSVIDAETQTLLPGVALRAHLAPTGNPERDGNFFQMNTDGAGAFTLKVPAGDYWFYVPRTATHKALSTQGTLVPAPSQGHLLQVQVRDDIQGNYAQVLGFVVPEQMVAGQQYEVQVTMRNKGNTTWTSAGGQPWRLGSSAPRDNTRWGMARVPLPDGTEVRPGETWVFSFTVTAPAQAGAHDMQWQMVQDGREWFGQMTQKVKITVTAPSGG